MCPLCTKGAGECGKYQLFVHRWPHTLGVGITLLFSALHVNSLNIGLNIMLKKGIFDVQTNVPNNEVWVTASLPAEIVLQMIKKTGKNAGIHGHSAMGKNKLQQLMHNMLSAGTMT